jgi:hypothetical protein
MDKAAWARAARLAGAGALSAVALALFVWLMAALVAGWWFSSFFIALASFATGGTAYVLAAHPSQLKGGDDDGSPDR